MMKLSASSLSAKTTGNRAASLRFPRAASATRPVSVNRTQLVHSKRRYDLFIAHAEPNSDVEKALKEAEEACNREDSDAAECATAWDTVEEISAAAAHKRMQEEVSDPLEKYCEEEPDADECRVYED